MPRPRWSLPSRARVARVALVAALAAASAGGLASLGACAPRAVQVSTAIARPEVTLALDNDTGVPVNVYVVAAGTELFLRQVPARSNLALPVRGVATGSTVTLRAVSMDGRQRYEKKGVLAEGILRWSLP